MAMPIMNSAVAEVPQFAQSLNFFDEDVFVYFWYWALGRDMLLHLPLIEKSPA
jgi:hypothetical protein